MKSCIILCGGRGSRMGQDKGLMLFQGKPMILHALERVKEIVQEVILVLRDNDQLKEYRKILGDLETNLTMNIIICTDLVKDQGPMAGILTGLVHVSSDYALVIPCDSPFISLSFMIKMFSWEDDFDAVVPKWSDGRLEPLHSLYHKRNVKLMKKHLKKGTRDVKSLFENLQVKYIEAESLDENGRTFWNINKPEDLREIDEN